MKNIFSENITWSITIIVSLLGIIAVYRLKLAKDKRNKFNDVADNFTRVFESIRASIQQNPDLATRQIVDEILKKNYPEQKIAMESLHRRLGFIKKRVFSKAWQKYVNPENCGAEPFLSYCGVPWEVDKEPFGREYILKVIEHLLSFAKLKK